MQTEFESQSDFLRDCIEKLKRKYPRSSFSQIAGRINLLGSTLTRIESGETKNPQFSNAMKIVAGLCKDGDIRGFLKEHYPPLLKTYDEVYAASDDTRFMGESFEKYFRDPSYYQIMLQLCSANGVSSDEVKLNFGLMGLKALDAILEGGQVTERAGRYYIEGEVNLGFETVSSLASNLVKNNYNPQKVGTRSNANLVLWNSVKPEVKALINDEIVGMRKRIWSILNAPESRGEELYWVCMSADALVHNGDAHLSEQAVLQ